MSDSADDVDLAYALYEQNGRDLEAAAKHFGVPTSSLWHRIHGRQSRKNFGKSRQLLSPEQEEELLGWINYQQKISYPVTTSRLITMASQIAGREVPRTWTIKFKRRNGLTRLIRTSNLEELRSKVSSKSIAHFFEKLDLIISRHSLSPADIWNFDEMGIHPNEVPSKTPVWVIGEHGNRTRIKVPQEGRLITVVEAISPEGKATPPFYITEGKVFPESLLPSEEILQKENFFLARTENAFITSPIALDWLRRSFIPYSRRFHDKKENWRLLILDGHSSHMTNEFIDLAYANKVELLYLPAHSTHLLQPLDVNYFGVIKKKYRSALVDKLFRGESQIKIRDFFDIFYSARQETLTPRVCREAFRKTGISPLNPLIYKENPSYIAPPLSPRSLVIRSSPPPFSNTSAEAREEDEAMREAIKGGHVRIGLQMFKKMRSERNAFKAQVEIANFKSFRLENKLSNLERPEPSRKRIRPSPNSKVVSRRAAANALDVLVSSPLAPASLLPPPPRTPSPGGSEIEVHE